MSSPDIAAEGIVGGNVTAVVFAGYLAAMIAIGLYAARKNEGTHEGYFLGGRRMSPFVVALSAVSSGRSAWLVLGATGAAWSQGLSAIWLFPGYVLAEYFLLFRVGLPLRTRSAEVGAITVPEVLASLAPARPAGLRLPLKQVAGVIVVLFLVSYVSAQLVAGGKALESIFHIDGKTWGLVLTAGIVLVYTLLGGYRAVAITDVLQGMFMLVGLVALPLLGLVHVGGPGALHEQLGALDPELLSLTRGWKSLVAGVAIGLGSFGSPPILVRAMSIDSPPELARAARIGATWNAIMALGALLTGLVGRAIYTDATSFPGGDREHLYPLLGALLSEQYLFAGFVGILLAALFAAIMSTCDSQLLVIASSFVRDFRSRPADDETREASGLLGSRVAVLSALAGAVAISYGAEKSVKDFVLFSWDALGAAFGPALLFLLFVRGTSGRGVLLSMLIGVVTVLLWGKTPELTALIHQRIPAFALASLALLATRDLTDPASR